MICCIQVVPDLYAVAITISSSLGVTKPQTSLSKWWEWYVRVLVHPIPLAVEDMPERWELCGAVKEAKDI
jgi:hypothetical protein